MIRKFFIVACCSIFGMKTVQADELSFYKGVIRDTVVKNEDTMRTGVVQDFYNMDKDKDDCATFDELNIYLNSNRADENREMFEYIDTDDNGCVTKNEMVTFVDQTINTIKNQ